MHLLKAKSINTKSAHACEVNVRNSVNREILSSRSGHVLQGCLGWILAPTPPEGRIRLSPSAGQLEALADDTRNSQISYSMSLVMRRYSVMEMD